MQNAVFIVCGRGNVLPGTRACPASFSIKGSGQMLGMISCEGCICDLIIWKLHKTLRVGCSLPGFLELQRQCCWAPMEFASESDF